MTAASAAPSFGAFLLFWLTLAASLIPWLLARVQQATNSDVLWLSEALRRVMTGSNIVATAYEPNPPLNMFIYTLPVLAQSVLHIPLHYGLFAQTIMLIALAAFAINNTLKYWDVFDESYVDVITAAFILANTYGTALYFGERDQMIALGLVPMLLIQLAITYDLPIPKYLKRPALIIGTACVLLKPHYGLLPAMTIIHRALKRRDFTVLKDVDFLILGSGCVLYALLTALLFPGYLSTILPDVLRLYVPLGSWPYVALPVMIGVICGCILALGMLYTPSRQNEKSLSLLMLGYGTVCLIPFGLQGMGLYYHLLPALTFFSMAFAGALYGWFRTISPHRNPSVHCVIILAALSFIHAPLNPDHPTHTNYKDLPLPQLLARECPRDKPCSFFMSNRNMGIMHETAYYSGTHFASRFPTLWFQSMLQEEPRRLSQSDYDRAYQKYSGLLVDDLNTMKPDLLLLIRNKKPANDFIPYYSKNHEFLLALRPYKKAGTLKMSYDDYYRDTGASKEILTYDIYKRVSP